MNEPQYVQRIKGECTSKKQKISWRQIYRPLGFGLEGVKHHLSIREQRKQSSSTRERLIRHGRGNRKQTGTPKIFGGWGWISHVLMIYVCFSCGRVFETTHSFSVSLPRSFILPFFPSCFSLFLLYCCLILNLLPQCAFVPSCWLVDFFH